MADKKEKAPAKDPAKDPACDGSVKQAPMEPPVLEEYQRPPCVPLMPPCGVKEVVEKPRTPTPEPEEEPVMPACPCPAPLVAPPCTENKTKDKSTETANPQCKTAPDKTSSWNCVRPGPLPELFKEANYFTYL